MPPKNKVCISYTLDPVLIRRINAAADVLHVSRSQFVEGLLRTALSDADAAEKFMSDPNLTRVFYTAFAQPGVLRAMVDAMGDQITQDQTQ